MEEPTKYVHLDLVESPESTNLLHRLLAEGWKVSVRWVSEEELKRQHDFQKEGPK